MFGFRDGLFILVVFVGVFADHVVVLLFDLVVCSCWFWYRVCIGLELWFCLLLSVRFVGLIRGGLGRCVLGA